MSFPGNLSLLLILKPVKNKEFEQKEKKKNSKTQTIPIILLSSSAKLLIHKN